MLCHKGSTTSFDGPLYIPHDGMEIPPEYLLTCSINPIKIQQPEQENISYFNYGKINWPVFAIARELNGEFLVYAHSPLVPHTTDISINGQVVLNQVTVTKKGEFFHITS